MSQVAQVAMSHRFSHPWGTRRAVDRFATPGPGRVEAGRGDTVEISLSARQMERTVQSRKPAELPPHIARVRAEIAAGTYLTEKKLDAAIERMLARLR